MSISSTQIIITLVAALISGMGTAAVNSIKFKKTEKIRAEEKARDELKIELKDLQIKLYKLEKDPACLNTFMLKTELGGTRKINKNCVDNIKKFLCTGK